MRMNPSIGGGDAHWQPVGELLGMPEMTVKLSEAAAAATAAAATAAAATAAAATAAARGGDIQRETPQQQQQQPKEEGDLVDFYSSMDLAETHKITSRKSDTKLLCFYFNATKVRLV